MEDKTLNISDINGAKKNISDIEVYGDGDTFALLCKASSKAQGWMKSTKVCNVKDGCLVQVSTQQRNVDMTYSIAEALTYVPNMNIDVAVSPRRLVPINNTYAVKNVEVRDIDIRPALLDMQQRLIKKHELEG